MRLIPAPKSASAMHFSSSGKSHGMRNFPGSPSFSGSFSRRTAEQSLVREVFANPNSFSLSERRSFNILWYLGIRAKASSRLILNLEDLEAGEGGSSEDLEMGDGWTTGGGTRVVLLGSVWSVIISGSRSTSLEEEEERGDRTEGPAKIIPLHVVIALIYPLVRNGVAGKLTLSYRLVDFDIGSKSVLSNHPSWIDLDLELGSCLVVGFIGIGFVGWNDLDLDGIVGFGCLDKNYCFEKKKIDSVEKNREVPSNL
ncbi:hypothetical protein Tco_1397936 [Tanacetum coccineum]